MRTGQKLLLGVGGLLATWVGWGAYVDRTTPRVPSETLDRFDGVVVRRYPRSVAVETTADGEGEAFRRLFRYISGENEGREDVAMTAPVLTRGAASRPAPPVGGESETVPMTAPVRTERDGARVTMAFFLPAEYTPESAPTPTDPAVRLVVEPPRTVAARRFSWYATDQRVAAERTRLLGVLADRGVETRGDPVLLQYDDPWTPPFMRRNEVEVPVRWDDTGPDRR